MLKLNFPDITLHFGVHRTATTSLQAMLDERRQALNSYGIDVLTPQRSHKYDGETVRDVLLRYVMRRREARLFGLPIPILSGRINQQLKDDLLGLANGRIDRLILSDENLLGPVIQRSKSIYHPQLRRRMKWLSEVLGANTDQIYIGVRSYDEHIVS